MKKSNSKIYLSLLTIILSIFILKAAVLAGSFIPDPASPEASEYNLSDIYYKLTTSNYQYSSHSFSPASSPEETMFTLADIWDAIPSFQELSEDSFVDGVLGVGIYNSGDLANIAQTLLPENIKSGVTLFGVTGNYEAAAVETCNDCNDVGVMSTTTDLVTGLVGYWPLDCDINDYAGDNDMTNNDDALAVLGKVNGAYIFDGVSHLEGTDDGFPSGNSARTVSLWFKPTNFDTSEKDIFSYGNNSGGAMNVFANFYYTDNSYQLGVSQWGTTVWGGPALVEDQWYHGIFTYDGSTYKVYLDSVLVASGTMNTNTQLTGQSFIGKSLAGSAYQWFGGIDEVALWDRVLDQDEIDELYNNGNGLSLFE